MRKNLAPYASLQKKNRRKIMDRRSSRSMQYFTDNFVRRRPATTGALDHRSDCEFALDRRPQ
jgi:hypothetical protein